MLGQINTFIFKNASLKAAIGLICVWMMACGSSSSTLVDKPSPKPTDTKIPNSTIDRVQLEAPGMVSSHLGGTYCYVLESQKEKAVCKGPTGAMHGDGNNNDNIVILPEDESYFAQVHVGAVHVCGLTNRGNVYCWGNNPGGLLFGPSASETQNEPSNILLPEGVDYFTDLMVGQSHSCALADTKNVYCWGLGSLGQLGDGLTTGSPTPVKVDFSAIDLAGGILDKLNVSQGDFACATTDTFRTFCWGDNGNNQIRLNIAEQYNTPKEVEYTIVTQDDIPYTGNYIEIQSGLGHSCGLTTIDHIWKDPTDIFPGNNTTIICFGDNAFGQRPHNQYGSYNPEEGYFSIYPAVPTMQPVSDLPNLEAMFVGNNQTCGTSYDVFSQLRLGCWKIVDDFDQPFQYLIIENEIEGQELVFDASVKEFSIGNPSIAILANEKIAIIEGLENLNMSGNPIPFHTDTASYEEKLTSLTWLFPEDD